ALGKSQELIAILNEVGIVPVVTKKIAAACRVYKANGVRLDYASEDEDYDDYQQLRRGNFATIVESHSLTLERTNYTGIFGKHVYTGVATGMSKTMNFNTDVQFALSDHADFRQVKDYIDATGASTVYTYGGNAAHLADSLSRSGCSAVPFAKGGEITQEMLAKSVI
ncbi:MAG: hypothetical protein KGH52_04665, partial [Candidatus Micrarchaeota archaeon]|nr:hypothetical protein [Candidatus Micrarchaeota archaeon]